MKRYLNNILKLKKSVSVKNPGLHFTFEDFSQSRLGTYAVSGDFAIL